MNLPIHFPSDAEVIAEEAARFRALSPAQRMETIRSILSAGALLMSRSPKAAFLREEALAQEELAQKAVKEFISRHGHHA
jgi:hypothetical protein